MSEPARIALRINGRVQPVQVQPDMPLLWVLRDELGLTGAKFGCGVGLCGACTIVIDGEAVHSCLITAADAAGGEIMTIEGLAELDPDHPLFRAWERHNVSQCGYCQTGKIMAALALLQRSASPDADEIKAALAGNLCRCGTYPRVLDAIVDAAGDRP